MMAIWSQSRRVDIRQEVALSFGIRQVNFYVSRLHHCNLHLTDGPIILCTFSSILWHLMHILLVLLRRPGSNPGLTRGRQIVSFDSKSLLCASYSENQTTNMFVCMHVYIYIYIYIERSSPCTYLPKFTHDPHHGLTTREGNQWRASSEPPYMKNSNTQCECILAQCKQYHMYMM